MIPLKFGLFWSGSKLSYLRYITFLSLRRFHPDSEIELYIATNCKKSNLSWNRESQDFQNYQGRCYIPDLEKLNVKIIETDIFSKYAPNYQSDFFRWWWLYNNGGFYLDTDQIILKSFSTLPLDVDFLYTIYKTPFCDNYAPVGAIGARKECEVTKTIMDEMINYYNPREYNSLGPFMFFKVYKNHRSKWIKKNDIVNLPPYIFYPIYESFDIKNMYENKIYITDQAYALHWFGGNKWSQEFNNKFDSEYYLNNDDTISCFVKRLNK